MKTGDYYLNKWYCDACWAVLTGRNRIAELQAEIKELKRRVAWFKWFLGDSWLGRLIKRILHGGGYEERLK